MQKSLAEATTLDWLIGGRSKVKDSFTSKCILSFSNVVDLFLVGVCVRECCACVVRACVLVRVCVCVFWGGGARYAFEEDGS